MSIVIERAVNGWYLIHTEEGEPDQVYVFDEGDSEETAAHAFSSLLYLVKNTCGLSESRYSPHRIYITVSPGDKHHSHPDNQENIE